MSKLNELTVDGYIHPSQIDNADYYLPTVNIDKLIASYKRFNRMKKNVYMILLLDNNNKSLMN